MAYEPVTPERDPRGNRGNMVFWIILGVVALVMLVWFVWDLFVNENEPAVGVVTIEDVGDPPHVHPGHVVMLRGHGPDVDI